MTASVGSTKDASLRKRWPGRPARTRAELTGPRVGCSRNSQTMAMATVVETTGRKQADRKKARPRRELSISTASQSPSMTEMGVTIRA